MKKFPPEDDTEQDLKDPLRLQSLKREQLAFIPCGGGTDAAWRPAQSYRNLRNSFKLTYKKLQKATARSYRQLRNRFKKRRISEQDDHGSSVDNPSRGYGSYGIVKNRLALSCIDS